MKTAIVSATSVLAEADHISIGAGAGVYPKNLRTADSSMSCANTHRRAVGRGVRKLARYAPHSAYRSIDYGRYPFWAQPGHFGYCETPSVLRDPDSWIRRRLRCVQMEAVEGVPAPQAGVDQAGDQRGLGFNNCLEC